MFAGLIVAGGRSTRFGSTDKAIASLAGKPMIRWVADGLTPVVDSLIVNCREEQQEGITAALEGLSHPVTYRLDRTTDVGPLGGIERGLSGVLEETDATYSFVAGCDMPFLDPQLVRYLFERRTGVEAVLPRLSDGYGQPLHAVYEAAAMYEACQEALAEDSYRVMGAVGRLRVRELDASELEAEGDLTSFENINTREAFDRASNRLASEKP